MLRRISIPQVLFFVFLTALSLFMTACLEPRTQDVSEENDPGYVRGKELLREGRYDQALVAFEKVVENRRFAPESHLELGVLYLERQDDPAYALYHFREYLKLSPDSINAPRVKGLINTSRKELARKLPGQIFESELDRLDLMEVIGQKDQEILRLKKQLGELQKQVDELKEANQKLKRENDSLQNLEVSPVTPPPTEPRVRPSVREDRVTTTSSGNRYTVVAGDTLTRVSAKVYNTPNRWREIYEANTDILRNPNALRVGMELRIP